MNLETKHALEAYYRCRISIREPAAGERESASLSLDASRKEITVPPSLSGGPGTVVWEFDGAMVSGSREVEHLIFCSRILNRQEFRARQDLENHYFRQALEGLSSHSKQGVLLLNSYDEPLYENPTARKWRLAERFLNYKVESEDRKIDSSVRHTILLGGTAPLKIHLENYSSGDRFAGRLVRAESFPGVSVSRGESAVREPTGFQRIIGKSPQLLHCIEIAKRAAVTDSTILIRGESGTGKEQFARAIHKVSLRREAPFVAINCAAIPEPLLESELFGYEKGAFTGADTGGRKGKLEIAQGGTVFLDEIGDMTPALQAKLLRVLQTREFERLGGHRTIRADVRFISATHKNLEKFIEDSLFRRDLYYRLNVIPLNLPSLRGREEEVELLAHYFLRKYAAAQGAFKYFTHEAMKVLKTYDWPGNTRELENVIQYCMTITPTEMIDAGDLPPTVSERTHPARPAPERKSGRRKKVRTSREGLQSLLAEYGETTAGKKALAARLGISLATLYRRLAEEDL